MNSENDQDPISSLNKPMSEKSLKPAGDVDYALDLLEKLKLQLEKMKVTETTVHLDGMRNAIESFLPSAIDAEHPEMQLSAPTGVVLNEDQKNIVQWIQKNLEKKEVFHLHISGPAGTGKSVVLRKLVELFGGTCLVVAPTGVAAVNVDGSTIHSAFKLAPKVNNYSKDNKEKNLPTVSSSLKVLIIDEISMVDSILLNRLDRRLKKIRNNKNSFGGLSVIVFGDFLQLEPIPEDGNTYFVFSAIPKESKFHMKDSMMLWENFQFAELRNNMRTKNDEESKILEYIRTGEQKSNYEKFLKEKGCLMELDDLNCEAEKAYREYKKIKKENPNKQFLIVAATNHVVNRVNDMALLELEPDTKAYRAIETFAGTNLYSESKEKPYGSSQLIPHKRFARELEKTVELLRVKEGSVVMLNCNLDLNLGLANGTMGTVVHCTKDVITINFGKNRLYGIQRELWITNEKKSKGFYQFPLRPATAVTIHKSQGLTVDGVIIITEGMFGNGSFYTAISRARELELCRITRFDSGLVKVSEKSKKELERMRNEKIIRFESD